VYGGITAFGATKLIPVTGTTGVKSRYLTKAGNQSRNITAAEYKVVVSEGLLPGGAGKFGSGYVRDWVLQQDGDPTHNAAKGQVANFNAVHHGSVEILANWPGNSPDFSPIENVWAIVDAKVNAMGCRTFPEYKKAVDKTFQNLPYDTLMNLFDSVPKRMRECPPLYCPTKREQRRPENVSDSRHPSTPSFHT